MRVLVYFNAGHQQTYLDVVRAAFDRPDDVVLAAGPGATDGYFGLAGEVQASPRAGTARRGRLDRAAARYALSAQRTARRRLAATASQAVRDGLSRRLPPPGGSAGTGRRAQLELLALEALAVSAHLATSGRQERRWLHDAADLLRRARPDVLVLVEDNVQGLTGAVAAAAVRLRIPYVVLPDYIPNPREPAAFYQDHPAHRADLPIAGLVARLAPRWVYRFEGRPLLRLPVSSIVVRAATGQRSPQPWVLNAGHAEAILLESPASRAHYLSLGFAPEKLVVVGSAVEERLHRRWLERGRVRPALTRRLGLEPQGLLVVCAFPPDQFDTPSHAFEHRSFEDMARAWFDALSAISGRANVLVRPHPRTDPARLRPYDSPTVRVVTDDTADLIPIADLFVACVSSTIRWALALGTPVIDYDCYRYGYGDFRDAAGVRRVTTARDFREVLDRAVDPEALPAARARAAADAPRWGRPDGRFGARLRDAITAACDGYAGPSPTHRAAP